MSRRPRSYYAGLTVTEARMADQRALTIHFGNGSKLSVAFPKQSANEAAARLGIDNILTHRQLLLEVDGALLVVPFENVRYLQLYPAPAEVRGHTYITGGTVVE
jgi:hypothetical protein